MQCRQTKGQSLCKDPTACCKALVCIINGIQLKIVNHCCILVYQHLCIMSKTSFGLGAGIQHRCCREGQPERGGSCVTFRNELSEEAHILTKQETLLGRASWVEVQGKGNWEELLCHVACNLGFYSDGISFWPFWLRVFLLAHALLSQDGGHWGVWEVMGHVASPLTFPKSFSWRWLVTSVFLTRTSYVN